ncbi:MAG: hypothetical protein KIT14_10350 [bacterium]|nr:hypothetical protein [bacterium]
MLRSWPLLAAALLLSSSALAAPTVSFESDRLGHLFVRGETPVLRVTVRADESGFRGTLRLQALDAYGRRAGRLGTFVALEPSAAMTHELVLRTKRLGYFAVSATLARRGQRHTAHTSAALVPPPPATPALDSAVGYYVYPGEDAVAEAPRIAAQMRLLGIRWVRFTFNWWRDTRGVPPSRASPRWLDSTAYERWVDAFRAEGIEVLATLFGTARWASSTTDDVPVAGIPRWGIVAPRDLGDWLHMVRLLAGRLAGRVRHWEIWNEPDIPQFWQSSAGEFATLVRQTAQVLRDVDPDARVVLNFVPDTAELDPFEAEVLASTSDLLDVVGWHYGHAESVALAHQFLPAMRPGAAIWDTEALGAPRRHVSRWLEQRAAGAERIFPFVYRLPFDDAGSGWERFGMYPVNLDYTPRSDAVALRTLSDLVGDAPAITRESAGLGYAAFAASGTCCAGTVVLADMNQLGPTWAGPRAGARLLVEVPKDVRRLVVTDLMGNDTTLRVRRGRARLRLTGVAVFLRAQAPATLTSVRVVRARAGRR